MLKSTRRTRFARSLLGTAALASLMTGCAALDRIKMLSQPTPPLAPIDNPTANPGYKPVQMPMPDAAAGVLQSQFIVAQRLARLL